MRNSKYITAERLEEIAAITPAPDDDAPEITGLRRQELGLHMNHIPSGV